MLIWNRYRHFFTVYYCWPRWCLAKRCFRIPASRDKYEVKESETTCSTRFQLVCQQTLDFNLKSDSWDLLQCYLAQKHVVMALSPTLTNHHTHTHDASLTWVWSCSPHSHRVNHELQNNQVILVMNKTQPKMFVDWQGQLKCARACTWVCDLYVCECLCGCEMRLVADDTFCLTGQKVTAEDAPLYLSL